MLPVFEQPIENYSSFEAASKVGALELKFKCTFFPHPMAPGTEDSFLKSMNLFATNSKFPTLPSDLLLGTKNQDHVQMNSQYIKSEIDRMRGTNLFKNRNEINENDFGMTNNKFSSFEF